MLSIETRFSSAGDVIIVLSPLTNRMTRTAVQQFWQVIDRITDEGQCDYYEVIIKVIKQGWSDICLKQMRYRFTVN